MFKNYSANISGTESGRTDMLFSILNAMIPVLMGIFLFFNPFPHTTAIKEFCFYLSLLALVVLMLYRKTSFSFSSPLTFPFILFFLWSLFGLFFALDLKNSIHDIRAHLFKYLIMYYLLINYFDSRKKMEILTWIVISSTTIFSLGAIISFYFIGGHPFADRLGVNFLEMHTNYIGLIAVFAIILILKKLSEHKSMLFNTILSVSLFVLCITTILTQARGAFFGLMISLLFLAFFRRKITIFIIIAIVLVMLEPGFRERLSPKGLMTSDRNKINLLTLTLIKTYPVTGIGFGMQTYSNNKLVDLNEINRKLPPQYQQKVAMPSPHNTILDITVRTGIIGLILFLNILITAIWMLWKIFKIKKSEYFKSWIIYLFACFISFFIPAMFEDTAFGPQAKVFYTILAMITITWNLIHQEKTAKEAAAS